MDPKVSFIVPVYGVEQYLSQCLDSIKQQTFTEWECILVDDGSPDNSGAICDEYAATDERFKVIHKQNAGVSAARNDGLNAARGEYAYFVDSDDWLELDACERLYNVATTENVDCVMSFCERIYPDGSKKRTHLFTEPFKATTPEELEELQEFVLYQPCSSRYVKEAVNGYAAPWAKFIRVAPLKVNHVVFDPYLNGVFDDGLWSLYALEAISSLKYIHEKTYNYRIVAGSLTHKFKTNAIETQTHGYERIEEFLKKFNKNQKVWSAYYAHVVRFFGGYLTRYYFHPENPDKINANAMLKEAMSTWPFGTAAEKVDSTILVPKDKWLATSIRRKSITGLKAYCLAKRIAGER